MTLIYSIAFIICLPFAIPYVIFYSLFWAIRERITEWRFKNARLEVTEAGKLRTRTATKADLAEKKMYRMADALPQKNLMP